LKGWIRTRAALLTVMVGFFAATVRAADLQIGVVDQHGRPLADAVIVAVPADARNARGRSPALDAIDQVDKQFVPYVKVVMLGSTVHFPNSDHVRHQVYSFSPAKKFELPLYAGTQAPPVLFDTAGVVVLGCNIHDWMVGYIYVADSPFFAKSSAQGVATLTDLPSGIYRVRIWHPGLDVPETETARQVEIGADLKREDWQIRLKATYRIPRLSGSTGATYP
jgi:plastocyanin